MSPALHRKIFIISILIPILLASQQQLLSCDLPDCLTCSDDWTECLFCAWQYTLTSPTNCTRCTDDNCNSCQQTDPGICRECVYNYGLTPQNTCKICNDPHCTNCSYNYLQCTYCESQYGINLSNLICEPCLIPKCQRCQSDHRKCSKCIDGYAQEQNGECVPCKIKHCGRCRTTSDCLFCEDMYGLNTRSMQCQLCSIVDPHCIRCSVFNINQCLQCVENYTPGLYGCQLCRDRNCKNCPENWTCKDCKLYFGLKKYDEYSNICERCQVPCLECKNQDYTKCVTCVDGYFLNDQGDNCTLCIDQISMCSECTSSTYCTACINSYYAQNGGCQFCPSPCQSCFYNVSFSLVQCTACRFPTYKFSNTSPPQCVQICGDFIAVDLPCDNGIGINYDGCDDKCQVEHGFQCRKNILTNVSICSYKNPVRLEIFELIREEFNNFFTLKVKVQPPLYVFRTSDLRSVFSVTNPSLSIFSVKFIQPESAFKINVNFTGDITNEEIIIELQPDESVDDKYFASVNSKVSTRISLRFNSGFILGIYNLCLYLCCGIVALGILCMIVGIISKRLAGIEAMFVYQMAWLSMLWLNSKLELPFKASYPLKFAAGVSVIIFPQNQSNDFGRVFQTTQNDNYGPHVKQFQLGNIIANNFNLLLFVHSVFLLTYFVVCIVYKHLNRRIKEQHKDQKEEQLFKTQQRIRKVQLLRQYNAQIVLALALFNMVNLTVCLYLFFREAANNYLFAPNLVLVIVAGLVYLSTVVLFCYEPDPFEYFRYAFRNSRIGLAFYYIYPPVIISGIILLMVLPSLPWVPYIPFVCMLLFTLIYKPYQQPMENYRSAFNMIVVLCWLSIRVFIEYFTNSLRMKYAYIFNLINILLLFLVLIVSYVSLIYNIYFVLCVKKETQEQNMMNQMQIINVREKKQNNTIHEQIWRNSLSEHIGRTTQQGSVQPFKQNQRENGEVQESSVKLTDHDDGEGEIHKLDKQGVENEEEEMEDNMKRRQKGEDKCVVQAEDKVDIHDGSSGEGERVIRLNNAMISLSTQSNRAINQVNPEREDQAQPENENN